MFEEMTARQRGAWAEELAGCYLEEAGYRIVHRNYHCPLGEIDIIAMDGEVLCFVEVRARQSDLHGHPLETIGREKIARIIASARHFLSELGEFELEMRFDALGILLHEIPEFILVKEAFET